MTSRTDTDRNLSLIDETINISEGMPNPVNRTRSLERITSLGKISDDHPLSAKLSPVEAGRNLAGGAAGAGANKVRQADKARGSRGAEVTGATLVYLRRDERVYCIALCLCNNDSPSPPHPNPYFGDSLLSSHAPPECSSLPSCDGGWCARPRSSLGYFPLRFFVHA